MRSPGSASSSETHKAFSFIRLRMNEQQGFRTPALREDLVMCERAGRPKLRRQPKVTPMCNA